MIRLDDYIDRSVSVRNWIQAVLLIYHEKRFSVNHKEQHADDDDTPDRKCL